MVHACVLHMMQSVAWIFSVFPFLTVEATVCDFVSSSNGCTRMLKLETFLVVRNSGI